MHSNKAYGNVLLHNSSFVLFCACMLVKLPGTTVIVKQAVQGIKMHRTTAIIISMRQ